MEVLIVLAILVMLVGMVAPKILSSQKKADVNAAKTQIGLYQSALEHYAMDMKTYPTTEQGLAALMTKIEEGQGTQKDLDSLLQLCGFVKGTGYCTLVTGASVLVQSSLKLFRHEYEDHIRLQRCPYTAAPAGAGVQC